MEASDFITGASHSSSSTDEYPIPYPNVTTAATLKRKRTKRPRATAATSSTSSSVNLSTAPTTTTEEEEDMAHCLILLAHGGVPPPSVISRKFAEAPTTATGVRAGFYEYECKTCNKCFPSFQALGGHRASHKKPKIVAPAHVGLGGEVAALDIIGSRPTSGLGKAAPRVHECSICGSEFSSGQALGGHMRRHRPIVAAEPEQAAHSSSSNNNKSNMLLSLDLNLPAPSEELQTPGFAFAGDRPLVFSAAALVDCHY